MTKSEGMRSVLAAGTTILVLILAGCAPRAVADGPLAGNLLPSLQIYTEGSNVHFVLQVTNTSTSPVTLHFRDGQRYDFLVREGERELWRWSAGQAFTQALGEETFAAGESRTYQAEWRPSAPVSGELVGIGRFVATEQSVELATRFTLP